MTGLNLLFSGYTGKLIVTWAEASAPNVEVGRSPELPFPVAQVYTVPDLEPVVYVFKFWQSTVAGQLNSLIRTWEVDASISNEAVVEELNFTVGSGEDVGDGEHLAPVHNDIQYLNNDLENVVHYSVEQRGFGKLRWGIEIDKLPSGGFQLINGTTFNDEDEGDVYFLTIYKTATSQVQVTTQNQFIDIIEVSANFTFGTTHYDKLLVAAWATAVGTITMPQLSNIPNNKSLNVNTNGGNLRNVIIQFASGESVWHEGKQLNRIVLGRGEKIRIVFKNGAGHVVFYHGEQKRVGVRELVDVVGVNQMALAGLASGGSTYSLTDFPRVADYLATLPPGQTIGDLNTWNTDDNKHFWYYNIGLGVFSFPDDRNVFYRAVTGADVPGRYQADEAKITYRDTSGQGVGGGTLPTNLGYTAGNPNAFQFRYNNLTVGNETRGKNVGGIAVVNI